MMPVSSHRSVHQPPLFQWRLLDHFHHNTSQGDFIDSQISKNVVVKPVELATPIDCCFSVSSSLRELCEACADKGDQVHWLIALESG